MTFTHEGTQYQITTNLAYGYRQTERAVWVEDTFKAFSAYRAKFIAEHGAAWAGAATDDMIAHEEYLDWADEQRGGYGLL